MRKYEGSKTQQVRVKAVEMLKNSPQGIRYAQLIKDLKKCVPEIGAKTIDGAIWNLDARFPREVYKPEKGLFRHTRYKR